MYMAFFRIFGEFGWGVKDAKRGKGFSHRFLFLLFCSESCSGKLNLAVKTAAVIVYITDSSISCTFDSQYICGYDTIAFPDTGFRWLRWHGNVITTLLNFRGAVWDNTGPDEDHTRGDHNGRQSISWSEYDKDLFGLSNLVCTQLPHMTFHCVLSRDAWNNKYMEWHTGFND